MFFLYDRFVMEMEKLFKDVSYCILMTLGKTKYLKELKEQKYNTYSLEKANFEVKDLIIDDEKKWPYIKGLMKKIAKNKEIIIDDLSQIFTYEERVKIFKYLENRNIKVIYLTSDVEDIINFPYTIVMFDGKVAMEGDTKLILQEEKLMKLLGYSLPFYVNLSTQLKYYGLLDKICYNKEELKEALWKSKKEK